MVGSDTTKDCVVAAASINVIVAANSRINSSDVGEDACCVEDSVTVVAEDDISISSTKNVVIPETTDDHIEAIASCDEVITTNGCVRANDVTQDARSVRAVECSLSVIANNNISS